MASNDQRYPLSTADGKAIPLDIVKPSALVFIAFENSSGSGSTLVTIPDRTEILSVVTDEDCLIRFGAVASIPASGVLLSNAVFVPAGMQIMLAPPANTLSVIGTGPDTGTLAITLMDKWAQLATSLQTSRI